MLSVIFIPSYVKASEGLPGSAKFGFGARVDIKGEYLDRVIETASYIGLDWVLIDFNWEEMWPDPSLPPKINSLTEVISSAYQNDISVLLSISNPPQWAMTENGPDPQTTANLTLSLVEFYSGKVLAVELYPGVNTKEGWNADPNVRFFLDTLKRTHETLINAGKQIAIVTTVSPEAYYPSSKDVNDLIFLSDLYQSGGKPYLTIVGVKFNRLTGDPLTDPEAHVLRHYEEIRSIMLKNDHNHGTIWVTGFSLPNDDSFNNMHSYKSPVSAEDQSKWIEEAYTLMRAQLYIGTAFFDQLNPNRNDQDFSQVTIISKDSYIHLIADRIKQLIGGFTQYNHQLNPNISTSHQENTLPAGKDNNTYLSILIKKYVRQIDYKHP
jgi:hypothetical protein